MRRSCRHSQLARRSYSIEGQIRIITRKYIYCQHVHIALIHYRAGCQLILASFVHESKPTYKPTPQGGIVTRFLLTFCQPTCISQAVVIFQRISSSWSSQYFDIYVLIRSMKNNLNSTKITHSYHPIQPNYLLSKRW